jgi:PAS domain S-box-containing protein
MNSTNASSEKIPTVTSATPSSRPPRPFWLNVFKRFNRLRSRLNFLIILAIAPLLVLTLYTDLERRQLAIHEAEADCLWAVRFISAEREHQSEVTEHLLSSLADHARSMSKATPECSATIAGLLASYPQYADAGVINADGELTCSAYPSIGTTDSGWMSHFQRAVKTRRLVIGASEIDQRTGRPVLPFDYPLIEDGGRIIAVVFAELKLDWFYTLASSELLPRGSRLTLLDMEGTVIARHPGPQEWVGQTYPEYESIKDVLQGGSGVVETLEPEGVKYLHAFMTFGKLPFGGIAMSEVPMKMVVAKADETLTRNLLIMFAVSGLVLTAARLFGQLSIMRKMEALTAAARRLGENDLGARAGLNEDGSEFGQLGHTFDEMARTLESREAQRKIAEEALRRSEETFKDLVESALTGICIIVDGTVVYLNREQQRLSGQPLRDANRVNFDSIHADDREKLLHTYEDLIAGKCHTADVGFRFFRSTEDSGVEDERWVHCRATMIQYEGRPAMLVNMMDTTEIRRLEHLLNVKDKMTSLGRLTAGIVHELRNPLSGLNLQLGNLERLLFTDDGSDQETLESVRSVIEHLKSASRRMEAVTRRVMDFSKPGLRQFVRMDINQCIEDAVKLSATTLRNRGIEYEVLLSPEVPLCDADPAGIEQVLLNLISNLMDILKDTDGPRKMEISTSFSGERILVQVSDSGPGVPSHLRERVFEPFFSTRADGMGIGLSISQRIALDHGGSLRVTSSRLGGAQFTLEIPLGERKGL